MRKDTITYTINNTVIKLRPVSNLITVQATKSHIDNARVKYHKEHNNLKSGQNQE